MKFTTQNECSTLGLEEILRNQYYEALKKDSVIELLDIAEQVSENSLEKAKDVETLAVSNALRIAAQMKNPEMCEYIIDNYTPNDHAKLEYFKLAENHLQSIFCINRMIQNQNASFLLLDRERSKIREQYRMECPSAKNKLIVELLVDDVYTLMWKISQFIINQEIEDISHIDLLIRDKIDNNWITIADSWLADDLNHLNVKDPNRHFTSSIITQYESHKTEDTFLGHHPSNNKGMSIEVVDCIVLSLDLFASTWKEDLFFIEEEYSVFLVCLILLDYVPSEKITEKTKLFIQTHLDLKILPEKILQKSVHKDVSINRYINHISKKLITCAWKQNRNTYALHNSVRIRITDARLQDKDILHFESLLKGYLFETASESQILSALHQYSYLELKPSSLYVHLAIKACSLDNPSIVLLSISVLKNLQFQKYVEIYRKSAPISQSYFLQNILYSNGTSEEQKRLLLGLCHAPVKELFTFSDAIYLLNIFPHGTHMPFFGYFVKHKNLISKRKITFPDGATLHLSSNAFFRSSELIKKYLKCAQRMYLMSLTDINPLYYKILNIFKYKKDYENSLAIDPYNAQIITDYIKHIYGVSSALKNEKTSLPAIHEMCKKAANAFMLCYYNIDKMYNTKELIPIYDKLLGIYLSLEITFKQSKTQKDTVIGTGRQSNGYLRMKKALEHIRRKFKIYPSTGQDELKNSPEDLSTIEEAEDSMVIPQRTPDKTQEQRDIYFGMPYHMFLRYDLWRIYSEKSSSEITQGALHVIRYSLAHVKYLSLEEYDYLIKIKIKRIKTIDWNSLMPGRATEEREAIVKNSTEEEVYSAYTRYLLSASEDVSPFLFDILKKNTLIEEEEIEEIIERMFFNDDGSIICSFNSWIPGMCIMQRKDYFEYLFEYLKKSDTDLLAGVKDDLRKKGFIV